MGLDNYARGPKGEELNDADLAAFEAAGPNLCGGIVSGDPGSFRGKVYFSLVLEITGVSLTDDFIEPARVKEMYEALRDCEPSLFAEHYNEQVGELEGQIRELRTFFKVCAERGLGIASWW